MTYSNSEELSSFSTGTGGAGVLVGTSVRLLRDWAWVAVRAGATAAASLDDRRPVVKAATTAAPLAAPSRARARSSSAREVRGACWCRAFSRSDLFVAAAASSAIRSRSSSSCRFWTFSPLSNFGTRNARRGASTNFATLPRRGPSSSITSSSSSSWAGRRGERLRTTRRVARGGGDSARRAAFADRAASRVASTMLLFDAAGASSAGLNPVESSPPLP
mmetsp:Transcript_27082/g.57488  ORF Transcript_27082/g.57488 Transcript_27082/m.57488 type:complete len:219 (+) Transcript_27082:1030-1686(+)